MQIKARVALQLDLRGRKPETEWEGLISVRRSHSPGSRGWEDVTHWLGVEEGCGVGEFRGVASRDTGMQCVSLRN